MSELVECPSVQAQTKAFARRVRRFQCAFRAGARCVMRGAPGLSVVNTSNNVAVSLRRVGPEGATVAGDQQPSQPHAADASAAFNDADVSLYTDVELQDGTGVRSPMPGALDHSLHDSIGAGAGRPVLAHSVPSVAQQWPSFSGTTEEASSLAGNSTTEPLVCGGGSTSVASQVQAGCLGSAEKEGDDSISSVEAPSDDDGYDADSDEDNIDHVPVDVAGCGGDDAPSNAEVDAGYVNPDPACKEEEHTQGDETALENILDAVYEIVAGLCCSNKGIGDEVEICGLQGAIELNGRQGRIVSFSEETQRFGVKLDNTSICKSVQSANLKVLQGGWVDIAAVTAFATNFSGIEVGEAIENWATLGVMGINRDRTSVRFVTPFFHK